MDKEIGIRKEVMFLLMLIFNTYKRLGISQDSACRRLDVVGHGEIHRTDTEK